MENISTELLELIQLAAATEPVPPQLVVHSLMEPGPPPLEVAMNLPAPPPVQSAQALPGLRRATLVDTSPVDLDVPIPELLAVARTVNSRVYVEVTASPKCDLQQVRVEQIVVGHDDGSFCAALTDEVVPPKKSLDIGPFDILSARPPLLIFIVVNACVASTRLHLESSRTDVAD
jgi:hypothetical protein